MKKLKWLGAGTIVSSLCLLLSSVNSEAGVSVNTAGKQHIGTFDGSTTFTTSSSNGINPGLFIEVRDKDGNFKQYTSEEGVVTVPNTKEGAYVAQAKLLGKTKYVDQDTGEILDEWEEGRNLKLESSKMPVLMTTGKNLFDKEAFYDDWKRKNNNNIYKENVDGEEVLKIHNLYGAWPDKNGFKIFVKKDVPLTLKFKYKKAGTSNTNMIFMIYHADEKYINVAECNSDTWVEQEITFTPERNYITICTGFNVNDYFYIKDIQIEEGTTATEYEPYKSNILSTSEDVELRGIGDVKDELNLLTGEVVERIGEIVLDGSQTLQPHSIVQGDTLMIKISDPSISFKQNSNLQESWDFSDMICDKELIAETTKWNANEWNEGYNIALISSASSNTYNINSFVLAIRKTYFNVQSIDEFKTWLTQNPLTIQYKLAKESIKTVDLTSTHEFNLISDSVVQIKGEALPTIYSITVPSEPLTFTINPNAEEGQKFIAPDFSITNESQGPVFLELKSFEQTTSVFNDVLPEEHEDWVQLTKDESKDIALALVPINSDGWLTLNEGEKYVATSQNIELGGIRAGATVDFSFNAYHGRVFDQNLFPEYRLVFTFGF